MPRPCVLEGIVIWVNTRDHDPPHFHARFSGDEVRVRLSTLEVNSSRPAPAKQRLLLDWASADWAELVRTWELARKGLPHEPIAPTPTTKES